MYGLVNFFFSSEEDKSYARQKLDHLKIYTINDTASNIITRRPSEHDDVKRTAHNMAYRSKNNFKCSGKIGVDAYDFIVT